MIRRRQFFLDGQGFLNHERDGLPPISPLPICAAKVPSSARLSFKVLPVLHTTIS